jgi:hypothetical protein
VQNERTIETWFTERLVVGHLQPLSDTEVAAMVSPIEIKGRWHSNLWDAACDQLEDNYARNYRSEGRGI